MTTDITGDLAACDPLARYLDLRWEDGALEVTLQTGRRLVIPDPTRLFHALLAEANGRPLDDLLRRLHATHPTLTLAQLERALLALDRWGLVEDADEAPFPERYERNLAFFGSYSDVRTSRAAFQRRLTAARVLVLGLGGIGSSLMLNLAGLGVARITAVDHDRVAASNLNRQFLYDESDIGASKVDRARDRIRALNPAVDVVGIEGHYETPEELRVLVEGHDLVLAAIDDPPEVLWQVNRACVVARVPLVAGGIQGTRGVYLGVDPGVSGCLDCDFARTGVEPSPDPRGGNRAIGPAVTILGGLMALEAVRHLTRFADPVSPGRIHAVDLATSLVEEVARWEPFAGCPTCGT